MKNNNVISLVLTSIYILSNVASANAGNTPTAETTLLVNAMSLQGEALTSQQAGQQLMAQVQNYAKLTAKESPDVRVANIRTALVDLSVATPAQATAIAENVQTALRTVNLSSNTDQEQLANQLAPVLDASSRGAQFSDCAQSFIALGIGSAIAAPLAYLQNTDHNSLTYGTIAGLLVLLPLLGVMGNC